MQDQLAVTQMLQRWQGGDEQALEDIMPVIYAKLRQLAGAQLRRSGDSSIQPTELVAEAYIRLINVEAMSLSDRAHFFSLAARTMRRVLVDRYRQRNALKRGSEMLPVTLTMTREAGQPRPIELDRLDDALTDLERLDSRQAEIVTMKFFGGLGNDEVALVMQLSPSTIKREWAAARLWLYQMLVVE